MKTNETKTAAVRQWFFCFVAMVLCVNAINKTLIADVRLSVSAMALCVCL